MNRNGSPLRNTFPFQNLNSHLAFFLSLAAKAFLKPLNSLVSCVVLNFVFLLNTFFILLDYIFRQFSRNDKWKIKHLGLTCLECLYFAITFDSYFNTILWSQNPFPVEDLDFVLRNSHAIKLSSFICRKFSCF